MDTSYSVALGFASYQQLKSLLYEYVAANTTLNLKSLKSLIGILRIVLYIVNNVLRFYFVEYMYRKI